MDERGEEDGHSDTAGRKQAQGALLQAHPPLRHQDSGGDCGLRFGGFWVPLVFASLDIRVGRLILFMIVIGC